MSDIKKINDELKRVGAQVPEGSYPYQSDIVAVESESHGLVVVGDNEFLIEANIDDILYRLASLPDREGGEHDNYRRDRVGWYAAWEALADLPFLCRMCDRVEVECVCDWRFS